MKLNSRLPAVLVLWQAALAPADIDYSNTAGTAGVGAGGTVETADDIHRLTSESITGLDIGYRAWDTSALTLRVRFYKFDGLDAQFPPTLLTEYFFANLPGDFGLHFPHLDFPVPVAAPQDLWIGFSFDQTSSLPLYGPPTIGSSSDFRLQDQDGDGLPETLTENQGFFDSYYLAVHVVPEPGALVGLIAGALLSTRRLRGRP